MKKWIVYLFLFAYLSTFTEVNQLTKLPNLIEHYVSHKSENPELSLADFLIIHYVDEQQLDADYRQDMKLPFKTHDFSSVSVTPNVPPEKQLLKIERLIFVEESTNFCYSDHRYPSILIPIWEPPKI
ncbi:hypothetical protein [Kaistella palustris]|uniref:hypothetical protein n=1 Tax=Kaistella palustris TaxID=493376 RepID=UPI000425444E|nr:hypothetical protein [Kaistella palustris]